YQTAIDITDNPIPKTINEAKFRLQFCTALSYVTGQGDLTAFNEENLWDRQLSALIEKIDVKVYPDINQQYPETWGSEVEILMTTGRSIIEKSEYPKGDPENPVSKNELITKYKLLTNEWDETYSLKLLDKILDIENMETVNIL